MHNTYRHRFFVAHNSRRSLKLTLDLIETSLARGWKRYHLDAAVIQKPKAKDDMEVLQSPEKIDKA